LSSRNRLRCADSTAIPRFRDSSPFAGKRRSLAAPEFAFDAESDGVVVRDPSRLATEFAVLDARRLSASTSPEDSESALAALLRVE